MPHTIRMSTAALSPGRCTGKDGERLNGTSEKVCPICGKKFPLTGSPKQVYCSVKCRAKQNNIQAQKKRQELQERTCPVCGQAYQPTGIQQMYCSNECRLKAWHEKQRIQKMKEERERDAAAVAAWKADIESHADEYLCYCLFCMKRFYSKGPNTLFCSSECMRIYYGL